MSTSTTRPRDVELQVVDPPADPSLNELAASNPVYVNLCRRAAVLKTTEGS